MSSLSSVSHICFSVGLYHSFLWDKDHLMSGSIGQAKVADWLTPNEAIVRQSYTSDELLALKIFLVLLENSPSVQLACLL
jgi:hypothetical protein